MWVNVQFTIYSVNLNVIRKLCPHNAINVKIATSILLFRLWVTSHYLFLSPLSLSLSLLLSLSALFLGVLLLLCPTYECRLLYGYVVDLFYSLNPSQYTPVRRNSRWALMASICLLLYSICVRLFNFRTVFLMLPNGICVCVFLYVFVAEFPLMVLSVQQSTASRNRSHWTQREGRTSWLVPPVASPVTVLL